MPPEETPTRGHVGPYIAASHHHLGGVWADGADGANQRKPEHREEQRGDGRVFQRSKEQRQSRYTGESSAGRAEDDCRVERDRP
jgi:hypothetical protein